MSEFDLRPFEVKKPRLPFTCLEAHSNTGLSNIQSIEIHPETVCDSLIQCFMEDEDISLTINVLKRGGREKQWTFEDIQVGWFFQTKLGCLYIKASEIEVLSIGVDINGIESRRMRKDSLDCLIDVTTITNVYDRPELAKVLMIKRIIT